jgi:hypothetical protein
MMKRSGWLTLALALTVLPAVAEDMVLFSAAKVGADIWGWGGARIVAMDDKLKIVENNRTGDFGDVYVTDKFAYVPEALIELNVDRIIAGEYTLQVLAFKGDSHVGTFDVFKGCSSAGLQKFKLNSAPLPTDTETIMFKIWVAGIEGASIVIKDLRYFMPVDPASVLSDNVVTMGTSCTTDKAVWAPTDNGGTITLAAGESYGAVLFPDEIVKPEKGGSLILQIPSVINGSITAQIAVMNENGTYVGSLDAIPRTGSGLRMARLDTLQWPPNAVRFQVKVWLEGAEGCSATIKRVLVLK